MRLWISSVCARPAKHSGNRNDIKVENDGPYGSDVYV